MSAIAAKSRTWTFESPARLGFTTVFTQVCPAFCESVHREGAIEFPEDVWHQTYGSSVELTLAKGSEQAEPYWVLQSSISTRPYALEPEERVPHVKVEFDEDVWTPPMDPAAFAVFIDRLAGHVEHLRDLHAQLATAVAAHQSGEQ